MPAWQTEPKEGAENDGCPKMTWPTSLSDQSADDAENLMNFLTADGRHRKRKPKHGRPSMIGHQ
ncbi:hypothetical protein Pan14r_07060 [Crateriforma conspicua]|uniref:Uncharacterized protein n=1 Tax=Crateriforma conspicua TaxID=2527996 RepID=A0A5C5Y1G1_9PLAN|nr:hypothetical protein Mal65_19110 [Crateriforma conspicua]TWT68461.1 hypothetical protein Pan14r_07060 [Crateriforma conspicua]